MTDGWRAYWVVRLISGVGVWVGLLIAMLVTVGVEQSLNNASWDILSMILGALLGLIWDQVIAAGFAGWVVYGNPMDGIGGPPIYRPQPREIFA